MNRKLMTSVSFASVFCFGYFSAERFCRAKKENTDAKSSRSAAVLGLFPLWEQFPVFQNQPALLTEKAPAFSVCIPDSSCRFVAAEKEKKERICSYDYYFKKRYRPAKSQ